MEFVIPLFVVAVVAVLWMRGQRRRVRPGFVIVYDLKTGQRTEIPAAELAPGMVQMRLEGTGEIVWARAADLKQGDYKHPPFPDDIRQLLVQLQKSLEEVYPQTLEFWEDGFRRDNEPEHEIALWLHAADIYTRYAAEERLSLPQKRDAFRVLVGCLTGTRETALEIAHTTALSREAAERLVDRFFGEH